MKDSYVQELEELNSKGLLRKLKVNKPHKAQSIFIDGREYINFSSNDYLALSQNSRVIECVKKAAEIYGVGSASSRLLSGSFDIHEELEKSLAEFKKSEAALIFPSGYQTNLGVISALVNGENDCVIIDKLNHASIIDGVKLSGAKILVYRHTDSNDLEKVLKSALKYRRRLIITDALFSMDGDIAPLKEISYLAERYSAFLMVDEAHSTGVFGKTGAGVCEELGIEDKVDIKMGTLSKAIGSQGGFVCVSHQLKNYIINKSRGFIYTTAISPLCVAAAIESIKIIREPSSEILRQKLLQMSQMLKNKLTEAGFDTLKTQSQIIPILLGETQKAIELSDFLFANGFFVPSIKYPTVPKNMARLRISLTLGHTQEQIEKLYDTLLRWRKNNA